MPSSGSVPVPEKLIAWPAMNLPLVSPELMVIVPVGAWFAVTVSVAALLVTEPAELVTMHAVLSRVGRVHGGEAQRRRRRAGHAAAVGEVLPRGAVELLPLVGERGRAAGRDGEARGAARGGGRVLRLLRDRGGLAAGERDAEHLVGVAREVEQAAVGGDPQVHRAGGVRGEPADVRCRPRSSR